MLDSRYIHLHEALGLGAMWLKQGAKIIGQPEHTLPVATPKTTPTPITKPTAEQRNMHPSRLAVLQKINSATLQPTTTAPPSPAQPDYPIYSTEYYINQLSGSIPKVKLMTLSVCASPADVAGGKLFSGEDGVLLHKMLAGIHLNPNDVYISTWLKDLPDFSPKPATEAVTAAAPRVAAEWQLSGATALLLMGDFFERPDVKAQLPKGKAYYIPHPQRILNNPTLKRSAWETLQQLERHLQAQSS